MTYLKWNRSRTQENGGLTTQSNYQSATLVKLIGWFRGGCAFIALLLSATQTVPIYILYNRRRDLSSAPLCWIWMVWTKLAASWALRRYLYTPHSKATAFFIANDPHLSRQTTSTFFIERTAKRCQRDPQPCSAHHHATRHFILGIYQCQTARSMMLPTARILLPNPSDLDMDAETVCIGFHAASVHLVYYITVQFSYSTAADEPRQATTDEQEFAAKTTSRWIIDCRYGFAINVLEPECK